MTIQRINGSRGHWYKLDGAKADGVTTIIGEAVPKPALISWAARSVAEHVADNLEAVVGMRHMGRDSIVAALKGTPWSKSKAAAAKGTEVHKLAEQLVTGAEVDVPEEIEGYVESCVKFLNEWNIRAHAVEPVVASRKWKYCGSADLLADGTPPGGKPIRAVWDYKTSGSGIYPETAYQLAAYRYAEVYLHEGQEYSIPELGLEAGYAVWIRSDGYDVIPVDCGEQTFKVFTHLCYVARALRDNKSLIGEAIYA